MRADEVVIEELVLRLDLKRRPEALRALGAAIAERVGHGLADAVPETGFGALDLRVRVPPGLDDERLAEHVAATILRSLLR
jgi:hypothetical protein